MNTSITLWSLMVLGQAGAEAAGTEQVNAASVNSIWDFVVKGGPMMLPIGIFSLIAMSVIFERMITLRRRNVIPPSFLSGLKKVLDNGDEDDRIAALEYCRKDDSPVAQVFIAGIKKLGEPIELLERHIQEAGERAVLKLRKYLRLLAVTASIAPLMGLLGTIFGMIIAFQTVATSGEALGKAELLAKGIYQAMITTAAGLMLAIPVLIAYHWISAKIEYLVSEIDQMTVEFIEEYAYIRPEQSTVPKLAPADEPDEAVVAVETA